jgi:hypothetical protein
MLLRAIATSRRPRTSRSRLAERLLAVGWLEAGHAYAKGPLPANEVIEALARMIADPWEPGRFAGSHQCSSAVSR